MVASQTSVASQRRSSLAQALARHWQLLALIAFPLAYLVVFKYVPMVGVQIAFRRFSSAGGIWGSKWVGLYQFTKFFQSYQFGRVLPNTIRLSFYSLLAGFPIPILLALCLNAMRNRTFRKTVQTVIYVPHFISTVVMVGMILRLLNPRTGLYGAALIALTGNQPRDILATAATFPHLYVWSGVWQQMGWSTIIYTAALSTVDLELHEAAQIDGASRFSRAVHVDFPAILPTAVIMVILSAGSIMSVGFEKAYLMQNQLNLSTSEVISTYVYKVGLTQGSNDYSYASAIGLFNSMVNLMMLSLMNMVSRRLSSSSLW